MAFAFVIDGSRFPIDQEGSVGSGKSCVLSMDGLRPEHARIRLEGDRVLIGAIGDAPVSVADVAVEGDGLRLLLLGDEVRFGTVVAKVDLEDTVEPVRTAELALAIVKRVRTLDAPRLVVVEGPRIGAEYDLPEEGRVARIGRGPGCAVLLDDPSVSREHARVSRKGTKVVVADMEAPRGTFLGGARLVPDREAEWDPGKGLRVGRTVLRLLVPDGAERIAEIAQAVAPVSSPPVAAVEVPAAAAVVAVPILAAGKAARPSSSWPIWVAGIAVVGLAAAGLVWILR